METHISFQKISTISFAKVFYVNSDLFHQKTFASGLNPSAEH